MKTGHIFGSKRDTNGEWRRLHNKKLHSLYHSSNIVRIIKSRRLKWAGHVTRMDDGMRALKILTGTSIKKDTFMGPRHRWEDTIRNDLTKMGTNTRNYVDLAQNRNYWRALMNATLNLRFP